MRNKNRKDTMKSARHFRPENHLKLGVGLLIAPLLLLGCEEQVVEKAEVIRPVRAIQLADSSSLARRWFSGRAQSTQEIDLSFRVSGPLVERPVKVGDRVEAGDVIARIDPSTFLADTEKMRAELNRARAESKNADAQLARQRTLNERGHVSDAGLDRAVAAAEVAKASVKAQGATLRRTELDLSYTELLAPFSGQITRTYVENFQDVREKQPIVRLLDNSRIEMVVDVPETLISFAPSIKSAEVIFDAFPDLVIPAEILEIGTEASETTRTYPVTLIMDQPEGAEILPGMAGKAASKDGPPQAGGNRQLLVPDTAVFSDGNEDKTYVWIFDPAAGSVQRRAVVTGRLTRYGYSITEGVVAGEWIVTAGVHHLQEGQNVRLLEDD